MDLLQIEISPERTIDSIIEFLKDARLTIRLNFYAKEFTLANILNAIDEAFPSERQNYKDDRTHSLSLFYINYWKTEVKYLFKSPAAVRKAEGQLSLFGYELMQNRCLTSKYLTPLEELVKELEINKALVAARACLKRGQLLNCLDVFPDSYFKAHNSGVFTFSPTGSLIRKIFGYYRERVPNLEDIGFVYSTEESRFKIVTDIVSNEVYRFTNNAPSSDFFNGIMLAEKKHGYITFFKIVGINREKHNKAILELNKQNKELLTSVHSKPHTPHKTPKPYAEHKPRTAPRCDAAMFLNETGEQVTVSQYATQHNISLPTARSRLRKLASLPVQKEPNELEWFLS